MNHFCSNCLRLKRANIKNLARAHVFEYLSETGAQARFLIFAFLSLKQLLQALQEPFTVLTKWGSHMRRRLPGNYRKLPRNCRIFALLGPNPSNASGRVKLAPNRRTACYRRELRTYRSY